MPNRVIKDSICTSPSLAIMSEAAQLHWPRWLLLPDDWGCFNADTDVIKGFLYPKFKVITTKKIDNLKEEYYEAGKIFLWFENEREWGYFTSWNGHQFCNATQQGDDGKQVRHKRKTPEPPKKHLELFISVKIHKNQKDIVELERVRAIQNEYRIPNPNPIPNPNLNPKYIYGKFQNVKLTKEEHQKLADKGVLDWIETLSTGKELKGYKYKSDYLAILKWQKEGENGQGQRGQTGQNSRQGIGGVIPPKGKYSHLG